MMFILLGLWGCSQAGNDARSAAAKIRQLETRNSKLEEDYRAVSSDSTSLRKKLLEADKQIEEVTKQNQELQTVLKERDELQQKLTASTGERDGLRVQLTSFSKELQSLTTRVQQVVGQANSSSLVTTVSQQK
jgi:chromosome segregation ATPase